MTEFQKLYQKKFMNAEKGGMLALARFFRALTTRLSSYEASSLCQELMTKNELQRFAYEFLKAEEIKFKSNTSARQISSSFMKLYDKIDKKARENEDWGAAVELASFLNYLKTTLSEKERRKLCLILMTPFEIIEKFA